MSSRIDSFLQLAVKQGGSDLHLVTGQPPRIRINGVLHRVRFRDLSLEDMKLILDEFMPRNLRDKLEHKESVDFAYAAEGIGRFRVNVYRHVHGMAAALRVIGETIPALEDLDLPPVVSLTIRQPKGLTLVTGPTGAGKSTTIAAMIDHINATRCGHIITLEDPIEYVHTFKKCVITQREIHQHARSLAEALRDAVREDPDVILVGELRDPDAISLALTAAEMGIQVLGTLHTSGASRTVDRIVNVFPPGRQEQVRGMLAESLQLIVSQQLVRSTDGTQRLLAAEILVNNNAVKSNIRNGFSRKLESVMQAGGRIGMRTLDSVLKEMLKNGVITAEEAYEHANDKLYFEGLLAQPQVV